MRLFFPFVLFCLLGLNACDCVRGSGKIIKERRSMEPFHSVVIKSEANVYLTFDSRLEVSVEAETNLLGKIKTDIQNGVLTIGTDGCISPNKQISLYLNMPDIQNLTIEGSGKVGGVGLIGSNVKVTNKGTGALDLEINAKSLIADIEGGGQTTLKGSTDTLNFIANNLILTDASRLIAAHAQISGGGNGDISLRATKTIATDYSGAGVILTRGKPQVLSQKMTGTGKLLLVED